MVEQRRADHRAGNLEAGAELACERVGEADLDSVFRRHIHVVLGGAGVEHASARSRSLNFEHEIKLKILFLDNLGPTSESEPGATLPAMTPEQCKAARALLNWGQAQLAAAAKCSQSTVARFEAKDPKHQIRPRTIESLRHTLEAEGIEFVQNGRSGVLLQQRDSAPRS